jgi:hypothetical protein
MVALTWLNLQRHALPEPPGRRRPTSAVGARPAAPPQVTLAYAGRPLTFRVAPLHPTGIPIPRQAWESVQVVRRRWLQWCAIGVHRLLGRREQPLVLPRFIHLF